MGLIASSGRLIVTDEPKLFVEVDPGIVALTRRLIPVARRPQPQRYPPHITVVRNEVVGAMSALQGREVTFTYDPRVTNDDEYWWLTVACPELSAIRVSLGLPPSSQWTRPPNGVGDFHITVGNTK